ncbi:unnamed protein product [Caenorhabditis bovis]|uniref:Uncharacterized protein n=1 Tax=Caenorhabditis bovis TaxID=2654633 RepID=A0A8S1EDW9_9PELO|nr:unnamed protein product [Caenorhabditis bovis]
MDWDFLLELALLKKAYIVELTNALNLYDAFRIQLAFDMKSLARRMSQFPADYANLTSCETVKRHLRQRYQLPIEFDFDYFHIARSMLQRFLRVETNPDNHCEFLKEIAAIDVVYQIAAFDHSDYHINLIPPFNFHNIFFNRYLDFFLFNGT